MRMHGNRNRFAFSSFSTKGENRSRTQCAHWVQQVSTGHLHINGFDSASLRNKKREAFASLFLFGAGNRNRTGTLFTARDFKSLVSTYSTMPASFQYRNIVLGVRQGESRRNRTPRYKCTGVRESLTAWAGGAEHGRNAHRYTRPWRSPAHR